MKIIFTLFLSNLILFHGAFAAGAGHQWNAYSGQVHEEIFQLALKDQSEKERALFNSAKKNVFKAISTMEITDKEMKIYLDNNTYSVTAFSPLSGSFKLNGVELNFDRHTISDLEAIYYKAQRNGFLEFFSPLPSAYAGNAGLAAASILVVIFVVGKAIQMRNDFCSSGTVCDFEKVIFQEQHRCIDIKTKIVSNTGEVKPYMVDDASTIRDALMEIPEEFRKDNSKYQEALSCYNSLLDEIAEKQKIKLSVVDSNDRSVKEVNEKKIETKNQKTASDQ